MLLSPSARALQGALSVAITVVRFSGGQNVNHMHNIRLPSSPKLRVDNYGTEEGSVLRNTGIS